ncbi:MAG TPA: tetratricopeptide repeat protein [Candidatus Omnitrophota bacterium]|nr:tetratricopeptide repeat protein [Candidatus Omnitrophota bacterium]
MNKIKSKLAQPDLCCTLVLSAAYLAGVLVSQSFAESQDIADYESKTLELLAKIDAFTEEDPILKADAAKAHYNMGNIYYEKGKYEIASREFYQAVTLMPDDPDAHYNLAYVSGENLRDFKTAVKHYKMYLYLKPNASDAHLVLGKIREAELALRAVVDSPLEEDSAKKKK